MLNHVSMKPYEVSEHTAAQGKFLVDLVTGEVITPVYEVFSSVATTDDKRFYSATSRSAHECTDPDQLADVIKYTTDMRGVQVKSELTAFKKENDYAVRTLKKKAVITNAQYKFLKQLIDCVVFKNIILCKRSFLCAKLGIEDKNLARKLHTVSEFVQQHQCKKGFIKLFVAPSVAYKGRTGKPLESAFNTFYKADKQTQYNALYVPFVGPPAPYTGPELYVSKNTATGTTQYGDSRNTDAFDTAEDFSSGDWWDKPAKDKEVIDSDFEKWFANNVGADVSDYFKTVLDSWVPDYNSMPEYEEYAN